MAFLQGSDRVALVAETGPLDSAASAASGEADADTNSHTDANSHTDTDTRSDTRPDP